MRPGDQLASTVCTTRVVVIRAPAMDPPVISCCGSPMVPVATLPPGVPAPPRDGNASAGTLVGKRYVDANETLELLCTASGAGSLRCDGVDMAVKSAKPLPASD
jgi:hypothetical protein